MEDVAYYVLTVVDVRDIAHTKAHPDGGLTRKRAITEVSLFWYLTPAGDRVPCTLFDRTRSPAARP
jgi:hypothetical protein